MTYIKRTFIQTCGQILQTGDRNKKRKREGGLGYL